MTESSIDGCEGTIATEHIEMPVDNDTEIIR